MRAILCTSVVALMLLSVDLLPAATAQPVSVPAATPASSALPSSQRIVPVRDFVRDDSFDIVKLSPDARYVARTVDVGVKTVLAIQQRVDGKVTGHVNVVGKAQVQDFWWINDNRLLISVGEKPGLRERRQANGDLYAINADGSGFNVLVGAGAGEGATGSYSVGGTAPEAVAAFVVADRLPREPNSVIVAVTPLQADVQFTRAEELNINSARRTVVAIAPVRHAGFTVDMQGKVRFAEGVGADNLTRTYYRDASSINTGPTNTGSANAGTSNGNASDWQLLNDESASSRKLIPLGFSANGRTAYLEQEEAKGPNGIYAFDIATRKMQLQLRDPVADPARILYGPKHEVIGVAYADRKPRSVFFDETGAMAKLYRSLDASFPDQSVDITSFTSDGRIALFSTYADRSPGD
ncbi:MAG TPA: hypothetical protein VK660_04250, partial [Xanthomonadaceae bacterium]|nr:hypothetical protein [Xanthomonadaceae bacterium]